MEKVSEFYQKEIEILGNKKAVFGEITLDVIAWIEDNHGDFENFQKTIIAGKKISGMIEFMYQILVNKEDFKDLKDFRCNFPVSKIEELKAAMSEIMVNSFGKMNKKGDDSEEKKSVGQN